MVASGQGRRDPPENGEGREPCGRALRISIETSSQYFATTGAE